ncbi:Ion transport protein [Lacunisphaera limnophila]|uniref:Ion transport protein n=1 Tax=Lacunisphaera limnophila TaxID=1838286 RepID=A0A1D8ASW3_9BACT|nr:ion transporter [Lacunisphaera limnophila]AOS43999.1 Ion transport protein [Lacunisphaera limnophila]
MVALAHRLVAHRVFQGFIIGVILLAGVLAGVETDPALVTAWSPWLHWLNRAILAVFTLEILLKLTACGREPRRYFADGWNVFDCLIVALCFLPAAGPFAAVLRLSRVLRLLRLVSALPKLQLLVGALLKSLSAMGYVSLLLALMFYVYAVAGVHLFGQADPADFGSLPAALFTLFRVVTLDNWGDAFERVATAVPGLVVTLYFVTFIVLGTMIILNLFIGIVMNSMAEMHRELEENRAPAAPAATVTAALDAVETQLAALQRQVRAARVDAGRLVPPTPGATD